MAILSFPEFNNIYQRHVTNVYSYLTHDMQLEISAHCATYHPDRFNWLNYLQLSSIRFYRAYAIAAAARPDIKSICDIGGLWSVFGLTMKSLGWDVTITEYLKHFSGAFDPLFRSLRDQGVIIEDVELFESKVTLRTFDMVTAMAVLEHYPHSLRVLMENIRALLHEEGLFYVEVPNVAYWPKRLAMMKGNTPLTDLSFIYQSRVPFIGHHHEFTISELRELLKVGGLRH